MKAADRSGTIRSPRGHVVVVLFFFLVRSRTGSTEVFGKERHVFIFLFLEATTRDHTHLRHVEMVVLEGRGGLGGGITHCSKGGVDSTPKHTMTP